MKKIVVLFLILSLFSLKAFAESFSGCEQYYKDRKYKTAASCFSSVVNYAPNDVQARFFYAASLFFDRQYVESYAQYNYIAQKYPNTEIGKYAKKEAAKVYRKAYAVKDAKNNDYGNYKHELKYCTKWYKTPIKVWVEPSSYAMTARKAFNEWETKSSYTVQFTFVTDPKKAQIRVVFVDKISKPISDHNIGITSLRYVGNMNTSADIEILEKTESNNTKTNIQLYPVILHEIGHALGISGHSTNNNDIMYENDFTNDIHLSNRDINTLKAIYKK